MSGTKISWLREAGNAELIRRGLRGVEKESLRVDLNGQLSLAPHPPALGSALTHPYLTTDYSEALIELVTPPFHSNWETLQFLCDLHAFVQRHLDNEMLWAASMPCVVNAQQQIPIAQYGSSNLGRLKTIYRHGLGHRYGRGMQAIAGVHFNFSLPDTFWEAYRQQMGSNETLQDFKSSHYMALIRNYRRSAWLVLYLFGASPAFCKSFRPQGHEDLTELDRGTWYAPYATSLRMSNLGYRNSNQARLHISADSLDAYLADLTDAVTTKEPDYERIGVKVDGVYRQLNANVLQIENEYYSSIRPKPKKSSKDRPAVALRRLGVDYVEVRTLDLSIADPVGVNQSELRFLEALLLYCLLSPSPPISTAEQEEIDARELSVAKEGRRPGLRLPRDGRQVALADWARELTSQVAEIAVLLDVEDESYAAAVEAQREAVHEPEATPSARLLGELKRSGLGFFHFALRESAAHRDYLLSLPVNAEQEERFLALAADSRRQAEELERAAQLPFDEFLAAYAREI